MNDELPSLPEPRGYEIGNGANVFTADQMRDYAAAAVARERERCAQLVATHPTYGDHVQGWFDALAAAIRRG